MRQTSRLPLSFRNEVVIIFDWLGDIFSGIGSAIGDAMDFLGTQISNAIWDAMLKWFYEIIYGAIADFFEIPSLTLVARILFLSILFQGCGLIQQVRLTKHIASVRGE